MWDEKSINALLDKVIVLILKYLIDKLQQFQWLCRPYKWDVWLIKKKLTNSVFH